MAWLLRGGEVLASVSLAGTTRLRAGGFSVLADGPGAVLFEPARTAHSIGAPCPLDVAYLDAERVVVSVTSLERQRVSLPRRRASAVLEAPRGAFERWGLQPGDVLEIRE